MARTKVQPQAAQLQSWHDADLALAEIASNAAVIQQDEARYNHNEQQARLKLTEKHQPLRDRIGALEQGLEKFCADHREDFGARKSRELQHGTVSYRMGTPKVDKSKKFTWDGCLDLLQKAGGWAKKFVRTKQEINKDAIIENAATWESSDGKDGVDPALIEQVSSVVVVQTETFGYDLKLAVDK